MRARHKFSRWDHATLEQRFWAKVDQTPDGRGCWLWLAATTAGYGVIRDEGRMVGAHVVSYRINVGPIPEGLEIDHLCRVRTCVNPRHLEPVTHKENLRRGPGPSTENSQKTHCSRGHEYSEANTWRSKQGKRQCRACWAVRRAERRAA